MSRCLSRMVIMALLVATGGCAGAAGAARSVGDAERLRAALQGTDPESLAPQSFAAANHELELAKQAQAGGDAMGAELHGDRAIATFNQAVAQARLARASKEDAAASEALGRATELAQRYAGQRKAIDHEADDLEKKLRVAREAQLPGPSGPAEPDRERARVVAAEALVTQAHLLCGAARLVSAQAPGLAEAEAAGAALDKQVANLRPVAIDPAARARAGCLAALTKARRATGPDLDPADTLLSELSQSAGSPTRGESRPRGADLAPARDERGVIVTFRAGFKGDALTADAEASLKDLGRVAAAHPTFAVQVVLHDAAPPSASEIATNQKRGEAVSRALIDGGAAATRLKVEQAGARAPVVDPKDARHRERNARIEIVFVSGG